MPYGLTPSMTPGQRAESYGILGDLRRFNSRLSQKSRFLGAAAMPLTAAMGPMAGMLGLQPSYDQTLKAGGAFSGYANPQAMQASQFQGATPGVGTSSGGVQRPMWMGPNQGPAAVGMGWDAAADAAVARNPTLSRTATGGVAGSPNPAFARPSMEQLATNRAAYQSQRSDALGHRQAGVTANATARADQRRIRGGDLTMEERMQLGVPGYAVAGMQADALRDVAANRNKGNNQQDAIGLLGILPGLVDSGAIDQQTANAITKQALGGMTPGGIPNAVPSGPVAGLPKLSPQRKRELAAMTREEAKRALRAEGHNDTVANRLLENIHPQVPQQPGMVEGLVDSPLGEAAGDIMYYPGSFVGGLFGWPGTPEPAGPSNRLRGRVPSR